MEVSALGEISSLGLVICAILIAHKATGLQHFNHRGVISQKGITKQAIHEVQTLEDVQIPVTLDKPLRVSSLRIHNHEPDQIILGETPDGASEMKYASRDTRLKFVKRRLFACCFGSVREGRGERLSSQGTATADRGISVNRQAPTNSNLGDGGGYTSGARKESTTQTIDRRLLDSTKVVHPDANIELGGTSGSGDALNLDRASSFTFPRQPLPRSEDRENVSGTLTHWSQETKAKNTGVPQPPWE